MFESLKAVAQDAARLSDFRRLGPYAMCLALSVISTPALPAEGGGLGNFGVGALTVASAFVPPPGQSQVAGYLLYFSADHFRGDSGKGDLIPDFSLDLFVEAAVFKHTWNFKIAGLNVSSALLQEAAHVSLEAAGQSDKATGNWALGIQPLILSGAVGNLHFLSGSYFFFPAGDFDPDSLANPGLNYLSFSHEIAFTWLPNANWAFDLSTNININGSNHDTKYRSGDVLGLTYAAAYRPSGAPKWQFGVSGLYFEQYEDDELNNQKVPGGFRTKKITGGPQIAYWPTQASAIAFKWHHEFEVRNGPQGNQLWIQGAIPF